MFSGKSVVSIGVTSTGVVSSDDNLSKELEEIQERHICRQVRGCLKPFRMFLNLIGRFPYTIHTKQRESSGKHKQLKYRKQIKKLTRFSKDSLRNLIKKDSQNENGCPSDDIEEGKVVNAFGYPNDDVHEEDTEKDEYCFVYNECSLRSSLYYMITILMLIGISKLNNLKYKFYLFLILFNFLILHNFP